MEKADGFIDDRLSSGSDLLLSERKSISVDIKLGMLYIDLPDDRLR